MKLNHCSLRHKAYPAENCPGEKHCLILAALRLVQSKDATHEEFWAIENTIRQLRALYTMIEPNIERRKREKV